MKPQYSVRYSNFMPFWILWFWIVVHYVFILSCQAPKCLNWAHHMLWILFLGIVGIAVLVLFCFSVHEPLTRGMIFYNCQNACGSCVPKYSGLAISYDWIRSWRPLDALFCNYTGQELSTIQTDGNHMSFGNGCAGKLIDLFSKERT